MTRKDAASKERMKAITLILMRAGCIMSLSEIGQETGPRVDRWWCSERMKPNRCLKENVRKNIYKC